MPASEADAAAPRSRRDDRALIGAMALAHALLVILAWPGPAVWPLVVLVPVPLVWLALEARDGRLALVMVGVTQFAMWLWIERWLSDVTRLGHPLFAVYMSFYSVLFVWLVRRVARHRRLRRLPLALVVAILWVGLECVRAKIVMHGFPWFLLGHPLIALPVVCQSADLFGVYVLSGLVAAVSGVLIDLVRLRRGQVARPTAIGAAAVVAGLLVANLGYGIWRLGQVAPLTSGPRVLAVQTNLPQSNKIAWGPQEQARDLPVFIDQTVAAWEACDPPPDLIVWPETMVPGAGFEPETLDLLRAVGASGEPLLVWVDRLIEVRAQLDVPMLVGSIAWVGLNLAGDSPKWTDEYNSAYLLTGHSPPQRYDKVFLMPFGETLPYLSAWPWLEAKLMAVAAGGMAFNLSAGQSIRRLRLEWPGDRDVRLATPICFEVTVAEVCRRMVYAGDGKATDLFVNISNDGWFGGSVAGRRRHLQIARFRCIENRVPMIRAVNTGLSASVDSCGRLLDVAPARETGWVLAEPRLDTRSTVYGRMGDVLAWLCLGAAAALVVGTMIGLADEK